MEIMHFLIEIHSIASFLLGYLLPIIMNLQKKKRYFQAKLISTPRAVIFAPTTELLHQVILFI